MFSCGGYFGDVSALEALHYEGRHLCLAGMGPYLKVFDIPSRSLVMSHAVLEGIRVHGIQTCTKTGLLVAVHGSRSLKVYEIQNLTSCMRGAPDFDALLDPDPFVHWLMAVKILDVAVDPGGGRLMHVAIGLSDNSVGMYSGRLSKHDPSFTMLRQFKSSVQTMLYSMAFWADGEQDEPRLLVASGTMFNDIYVWKCDCLGGDAMVEPSMKLSQHQGAVLRLRLSHDGTLVISASEDRTFAIWDIGQEVESLVEVAPLLRRYGHKGRVWDAALCDGMVATASEDCTCRLWSLVDGSELKCLKGHHGRGIWCCQFAGQLLLTGGADGSIKMWDLRGLEEELEEAPCSAVAGLAVATRVEIQKDEVVRGVGVGSNLDRIFLATGSGRILMVAGFGVGGEGTVWSEVFKCTDPGPLVDIDVVGHNGLDCVCAGHCKGIGVVAFVPCSSVEENLVGALEWQAHGCIPVLKVTWGPRLPSSGDAVSALVCTMDGCGSMACWRVEWDSSETQTIPQLICRVKSCLRSRLVCGTALLVGEDLFLAAGDLKGGVMAWAVREGSEPESLGFVKGVHGSHPVGLIAADARSSSHFVTGGQDGCLKTFSLGNPIQLVGDESTGSISTPEVLLDFEGTGGLTIGGFQSTCFILWSCRHSTELARWECGGRNRPHAFGVVKESGAFMFAFHKDGVVFIMENTSKADAETWSPDVPVLHASHHGREISCCFALTPPVDEGHGLLILTGSDEGVLRGLMHKSRESAMDPFSWSGELGRSNGGTAIKAITAHRLPSARGEGDRWLLVTVGAKEVVMAWTLTIEWNETDAERERCRCQVHMLCGLLPAREGLRPKANRRCLMAGAQSRLLGVSIVHVSHCDAASSVTTNALSDLTAVVVLSSSDGFLRMMALVDNPPSWKVVADMIHHQQPVLSLDHVKHRGSWIFTGATDGSIGIWEVEDVIHRFAANWRNGWNSASLEPVCVLEKVHQSGVNCMSVAMTEVGDNGLSLVTLVSGGDDQLLSCVRMSVKDSFRDSEKVTIDLGPFSRRDAHQFLKSELWNASVVRIANAHASALRGIWTNGENIFSVGLDQKLRGWELELLECSANQDQKYGVSEIKAITCAVPEPADLAVTCVGGGLQFEIVVVGRGVEVFEFHQECLPKSVGYH
ncbi:hypothetical protein BSKO_03395 [Bryopsis sp. KO-2023]|nr:hypothetical protein BSKO_03395 [Bryopsis sp. KO-2023]